MGVEESGGGSVDFERFLSRSVAADVEPHQQNVESVKPTCIVMKQHIVLVLVLQTENGFEAISLSEGRPLCLQSLALNFGEHREDRSGHSVHRYGSIDTVDNSRKVLQH